MGGVMRFGLGGLGARVLSRSESSATRDDTGFGRGRPASWSRAQRGCGWQAAAARVVVARERQRRIEGGCPVGGIASVSGAVTRAERDVVARRHFFPFGRGYAGVTEVVPLQAAFLPIRPRLRRRKGSCAPPGGISSHSPAVTAA